MSNAETDSPSFKVIIPFRLREGADMRRAANLEIVLAWWWMHGVTPVVIDDGNEGDAQFNRHKAYNKAVAEHSDADVLVFSEADMLMPIEQIIEAVQMAHDAPGIVVPFLQYRYLSDDSTAILRDAWHDFNRLSEVEIMGTEPESTLEGGRSIGPINVISTQTIADCGGFTEATSGNWYDDNIIEEAYKFLTGRATRFVRGSAVHLYHLPGHKGDHLSAEDRRATARNKRILTLMRTHIRLGSKPLVKALMLKRRVQTVQPRGGLL